MVDARKYASRFIKPDNVREGPIRTRVVNAFEDDRYGRLTLELETGSQFGLNESNANVLIKVWGTETDNWIGQDLELALGTYRDFRTGEDKETVRVVVPEKPASAGNGSAPTNKPLPPSRVATSVADDLNDEVPF